jgi:hypothetical protein
MMSRLALSATAVLFAVGCNTTVSGTLVDGITGAPIAGAPSEESGEALRVIAEAVVEKPDGGFDPNPGAGLTCMTQSSEVGADGSFKLAELCLSSTSYRLKLSDTGWFLGETDVLTMGSDGSAAKTLKAWHAPTGTGVKTLIDGKHGRVTARVNLKSETIKGTESEKVWYPEGLPGGVTLVPAEGSIVITGTANKDMKLIPLINSGPREFKIEEGMETGPTMAAWAYMGTRFTDDTTFERVEAQIDASKVTVVEHRGHFAKFIPASAVTPPGRYALYVEGQNNALVVDLVEAGKVPGSEEAPAPEAPADGAAAGE